ncbi:TetR/AcrR family transcriptional regulator [Yinghuangia sp. YIM S09857]|uniref:TetR/AcrR family transcriptional regulator n=1 Tax=Yinghuangia sp. YIM S09857 TaxID=3436929 RepID=UPI003F52BF9D
MAKPSDLDLDADRIVAAAIEILGEQGLDAVSMRSVAARLGVSPVPLYSRVGNKEALVEAIADRLLADLAPGAGADEPWTAYAARWAAELRSRLRRVRDSRLIVAPRRQAYVEASRPLVEAMRRDGLPGDTAVRACRLIMWATVGFVALESGASPPPEDRPRRTAGRPGSDPSGVSAEDADTLFDLHIRYLVEGIARDAEADGRLT